MTTTLIDVANCRSAIDSGVSPCLLDVRTGAEFESAHISGSLNIPLDRLSDHASAIATAGRPIVLVCKSGGRAQTAKTTLAAAGAADVSVLDGGIDAWQSAGEDLVTGSNETWSLDRQVRLVAGSLCLAGIVASVFAPRAKWASGMIGGGLVFSAVSDTCAMGNVLARLPYNRSDKNTVDHAVRDLTRMAA